MAVGPTAADLVNGLLANHAYSTTTSSDTTVDGYPAKRVDLQLPSDVGLATCDKVAGTQGGSFFVWGTTHHGGGSDLFAQGPGNRWTLWIVDVAAARLVIVVTDYAGTPAADRAAGQAIVHSVTITP